MDGGTQARAGFNRRGDSLGGAAKESRATKGIDSRFNRRGDSLGGAALQVRPMPGNKKVSIAGAILWGVLLEAFDLG